MTFDAIIPISARKGEGIEELLNTVEAYLPEGPQLFPRRYGHRPARASGHGGDPAEKLLCLDREIPHGTAVEITKFLRSGRTRSLM